MKVIRKILVVALLLMLFVNIHTLQSFAATNNKAKDIKVSTQNENVRKVVRVYDKSGVNFFGSGFFIQNGYVITGAHVTQKTGKKVQLVDGDLNKIHGTVVAEDTVKDLALIKTDQHDHAFFPVAESTNRDARLTVIINSRHKHFVEKKGRFDQMYLDVTMDYSTKDKEYKVDRKRSIYTFRSEPGYSGSAVFNEQSEVIGVITGHLYDSGLAIGIMLEDIKDFLAGN